ncbi:hypothetical protein JCM5353_007517 [Sporobolomyces roseus]
MPPNLADYTPANDFNSLASLDLYSYLSLPSSSTQADLKTSYRSLLLRLHPDRQNTSEETVDGVGIREVNLAWSVLGDEERRKEYDRLRKAHLSATKQTSSAYAHSVSLDLFDLHTTPEGGIGYYTYPCRCSSRFKIMLEELEEGVEVVGCEGCSERCRVEYEVLEEEEEG